MENICFKKFFASFLTFLFLMQQTMVLPAFASEITSGGSGNVNIESNPISNGHNTEFNIRPDFNSGDFGFKHYTNFNLSEGDVANLIFALKNGGDISKFVNLVDSRIIINGILNGVLSNGNIGGHAIFVSPQGMVVGASGVLNVGALTAIAPTQQAYTKYIADSAIGGVLPEGYTHENNLAVLKASDMALIKDEKGNIIPAIDVQGKIIARQGVELVAKNIRVGNTVDNKAGILAGVNNNAITNGGQNVNAKLASTEAAGKLFDALVSNDIKNGSGFSKDPNGNIVIKAQSIKQAVNPGLTEKLTIEGKEYLLNELVNSETGEWLDKNLLPEELQKLGVDGDYLTSVLKSTIQNSIPSDATNANAHNDTNFATVDISNAILKASNNIDISATSKIDYIATNTTILDSMFSSAIGQMIEGAISGDKFDFEGARAKAEVNIDSGAQLIAGNNAQISSNAIANTLYKSSQRFAPALDTTQELYYALGSKTVSSVNVNKGAQIKAGNDLKIHAQSQNAHNIKIKNPTSTVGATIDKVVGIPNIQVIILANQVEADTTAAIHSGAIIEAANVEVDAVNHSSISSNVQSLANVTPDANAGAAVAVNINNTHINTSALIDTEINTQGKGDVSVNAQNLYMGSTIAKADVTSDAPKKNFIDKMKSQILSKVVDKFAGLLDMGGNGPIIDTSGLPNVSVATVINDSNVNTNATIGKNASIHADNVKVNANTIDLTVNNATSNVKIESKKDGSGSSGVSGFIPNPGVAVIVNEQNNSTKAVIESGTDTNHATVVANNKLDVNATTELPRNSATIEFILNLLQTGKDITDLDDAIGNIKAEWGEDWDIRLLLQGITNPVGEVSADISNVVTGFKTSVDGSKGLAGFFNNWAATTSKTTDGMGLSASVISSAVNNETVAQIGQYADVSGGDVVVNAANKTVQYNAAGDITNLIIPSEAVSGANGVGGNVIVESVTNNTKALIDDNAKVSVKGNVDVLSGTENQFVTVVNTGSKASGKDGFSISGSVTVQNFDGTTSSSVGKALIKANNLNVKVGDAKLNELAKADDQFSWDKIWEDLPTDGIFDVSFDPDLSSPTISNFGGIDETSGLLSFKEQSTTIKDGISNILFAGATSEQELQGGSGSSSSGGAVGASVNVSLFDRVVSATIADGANITLNDSLNVNADSRTQSLNLAFAGAFAGGVKVEKPGASSGGILNSALSKTGDVFNKIKNKLASTSTDNSVSTDKNISVDGKDYKVDSNNDLKDANGNALKDSNGNNVKYQGSTGKEAGSLDNLDASKGHANNISVAAAGSVNTQINESVVKAEIGNATINVGNNVNVEASQATKSLNVGGGVANASTVGAGAAVNFIQNSNQTIANVDGTNIIFNKNLTDNNKLNVIANENNDNIQVAIGVGVGKKDKDDTTTTVVAGGSFNADVLENSVAASINNATVSNNNGGKIDVDVDAENHSTAYKGAGGLSVSAGKNGTTSVGAGMGGNLNIINKNTEAKIQNSTLKNVNNVSVAANKDSSKLTEDLVSVGVGGTVITGAQNGYTFSGAMATDVIENQVSAIVDNSTIVASGDLDAFANNNFRNINTAGALGFSTASTGVGIGIGAIVSVINNTVTAAIQNNSNINANSVDVNAKNNEDLYFLAANMGVQTGSGIPVSVNGIVNVIKNNVNASIISSNVTSAATTNVIADYDNSIQGVTVVGAASNAGVATIGANVLSNTLLSNNTAQVLGSNVISTGKLTVKSTSDGNIDIIPVAAAISVSGTVAAAANVGVNVVSNTTTAKIDKDSTNKKSTVSANDIDVVASDNTKSRSRGGTIAATGGTAGVGGSILADVYTKNVDAHIDNATITNGGNIKVDASAKNIFGAENPSDITLGSLTEKVEAGEDIANSDGFENWDMTFDIAGGNTAGVSGSLISKNVINNVNSYIGSNVEIQNAGSVDVLALNKTVADVIVGNVTGAGTAAVGGSVFSNVNVSDVNAYISNGAKIGTVSKVGNINVDAESSQVYKSIMFIVGGAGVASVNGSINSNIVANSTNAYIGNGVNINSNGSLIVDASDSMDIESVNIGVGGAGGASVGGVVYVDVLANKVNAIVGKNATEGQKAGNINVGSDVLISANNNQNFKANIALIKGSGAASVDGVAISNTMASEVNAGIENTTLKTTNGKIEVKANNDFNKGKQATGIGTLFGKDSINSSDVTALLPLVGIVNVAGSGGFGVGANVIANVVSTAVSAYVNNATVSSTKGLNISANSTMNTYDAVISTTFGTAAGVGITGVNNIYSGTTKAIVENSIIENGDVNVAANDIFNLNTVVFSAAGALTGGAVSAVENANVIENNVLAHVVNTDIQNTSNVILNAINSVYINDIMAAASVAAIGGGVNVIPVVNQFTGKTEAKIEGGSVNGAATSLFAKTNANVNAGIIGATGAGTGASVGGYTVTNIFDNDIHAKINGTTITNAKSTSVNAESDIDISDSLASGGLAGIGANGLANVLVNVINNNVTAYIADSSIQGGSVSSLAMQNTNISNSAYLGGGVGAGVTAVVNTVVNSFENNLISYIDNTSLEGVSTVSVVADSDENLENTNIGVSVAKYGASVGSNTIVNSIENTTKAYIDAKDKSMNASGKVSVVANDQILIDNELAMFSVGTGAMGASVDVNVINNAVISELLTTQGGKINAGNVEVLADSVIGMDNSIANAVGGVAGIAANVVVNSIGGKVDFSGTSELNSSKINDSLAKINGNSNNIQYEKDGQTKTASYNLTSGTIKDGTKANINGNVSATGKNSDGDAIKVAASNKLKGYNDDTFSSNNIGAGVGLAAMGASVLVTNMKYKTDAEISGGSITAGSGNVKVDAVSNVKAEVDVVDATVGVVGIKGGVGYFNNAAQTIAKVADATINTNNNLLVNANSNDSIDVDVISVLGAAAGANVSVSITETSNNVQSLVSGNVDIDANDVNILASNTSNLTSKLDTKAGGGLTVDVAVNRTKSDAITHALINATGTIDSNNMNIIASSDGINAKTTMSLGTYSIIGVDVANQGAVVNSEFMSGIDNAQITVNNKGKTNIASGVKKSDNTKAALMKAEVISQKSQVSLADVSVTKLNASVNSKTEAKLNTGNFTTKDLEIRSMSDRDALVGNSSNSLGAISVKSLDMNASAKGSNTIDISGNNTITGNAQLNLDDDAYTNTQMLNANLSIVNVGVNESVSEIDTDTTINIGGTLAMNDMNVSSKVSRNSYNSVESDGTSFVGVQNYKITTTTQGDSNVNITANATNQDFNNGLSVIANAVNTAESIMGESANALVAISKNLSGNTVNASNNINVKGAKFDSQGDFNLSAKNENRVLMKRSTTQNGVYVNSGGSLYNNMTSLSKVNVQDGSDIKANNVNISSTAEIGTKENENIAYTIKAAGGIVETTTTIDNNVSQTSEVNVKNSNITAKSNMNVNVDTNSAFSQSVNASGSGFVANVNGFSNLTVTNNNIFNVLNNSTIAGDYLNIALDSSNTLKNNVDLNANHFGFRDIDATSNITLNVNNLINNEGHIRAGSLAQFDFMKNSTNILDQDVKITVDAAIPTSVVDGKVVYAVNNKLIVAKNADIISSKDVIVNYSSGNSQLTSDMIEDLTCRIVFGIPIHTVNRYSRIDNKLTNALQLDGVIKAGDSAQRYMYIDKDGNIDVAKLKGFLEDEYKIVDAANISGEQLTQDTIKGLQEEAQNLKDKISKLDDQIADNKAIIDSYKEKLTEINDLLNKVNNAISVESAANQLKSEVQTAVVGSGDNQVSQELFDQIWAKAGDLDDSGNSQGIASIAKEILKDQENLDNKVKAIEDAYNTAKGDFTESNGYTLYNGQIVLGNTDEDKNNAINDLQSGKTSLESIIAQFESVNKGYQDNRDSLNNSLTSVNDQISYLIDNPLSDLNIEKAAIEFANLTVPNAKIQLNGIEKADVKGSGEFRLVTAGLGIDNYSNRDLVFKNINLDNYSLAGLIIGGTNYNYLANSSTPVNDNVYLKTEGDIDGIVINNYYDHMNPTLEDSIASNIIFNGSITASGDLLDIWNESGNIEFNAPVSVNSKDIVATQGNVTYNSANSSFDVKAGDRIIAGQNIDINAKNIKIDGTLKAGYGDRNLTITDDMLNNLVVDPTTGEKNMVNLGGSDKSSYLNTTNNIKVLYKDGKLLVFNTKQEGGNVNLKGSVTGNGSVTYTDGYATVSIDNQTDKQLVINTLENNRMNGSFDNRGTITNITNQGSLLADTTIKSNGFIEVLGSIKNGLGFKNGDSVSVLNINGQNGILVDKKLDETGIVVPTIESYGNTNITNANTNSGVVIDGVIKTSNGNTTITNDGSMGVSIAGTIDSELGNVSITNSGVNGTKITGLITNTAENISITNDAGKLTIFGTVQNQGKDLLITNNGDAGTEISGLVSNSGTASTITINNTKGALDITKTATVQNNSQSQEDNMKISNSGEGLLSILGNVFNLGKGNVVVDNTNTTSGVVVAGNVENASGNVSLKNEGNQGSTISGKIKNSKGSTTVTNNGGKLLVSGTVENAGTGVTLTNNGEDGTEISGLVSNSGTASTITINNIKGALNITETAIVQNNSQLKEDNMKISNSGGGLLSIFGKVLNIGKGNTVIDNTNITSGVVVAGNVENASGNVSLKNEGNQGSTISGKVKNSKGSTTVTNNGGKLLVSGTVENAGTGVTLTNNGEDGTEISGLVSNSGTASTITINNTKGALNITKTAIVQNNSQLKEDNMKISNSGEGLLSIFGKVLNIGKGNTVIDNTNTASGAVVAGTVKNNQGNISIDNNGNSGITLKNTALVENAGGNLAIDNKNINSGIVTENGSKVVNNNGKLTVNNEGASGMSLAGSIQNKKGVTVITNNNDAETSSIILATTGRITNNDGKISISNKGTKEIGIAVEGIISAIKQDIEIINENSDISIGEYDSNNDFYINTQNGSITITQVNGDILNGIVDPDTQNKNQNHDLDKPDKAYKTLISSSGNLNLSVTDGNIGSDTHALEGKESGFGVNASTRDYTESINVKVNGVVKANATNNGNALINIRAKNSDLKVDNITSDGNVMLTAADWKQKDQNPTPADDAYFHGYSIINAASDKSKANVTGRNISLIGSDNVGVKDNKLTYYQLDGGSISAMAENDLYISGMGNNDNFWQLITKRGNMGLEFTGDAIIREITAGKHLEIVSKGANLTIYDLGKVTNMAPDDDILYPHDRITITSVAPETVDIRVLDINPDTRVNPNDANSTLNIYNAYIKGQSNGKPDVTLRADNIIAHAYDAASSVVSNKDRPNGFDATEGRLYANDYMNPDSEKNLKATGFNTVGKGDKLVFDIQGVSPDDVVNAGGKESDRNYKPQDVEQTMTIFNNPVGFKETVYKAKDVTLSLNSASTSPTDNRGMELLKFYSDNAYVDTKDLNLHISDGFITNYAEFRNGNRGGQGGGHFVDTANGYRWLTIVDNDYYRNIANDFGIPVTSQLYTKLTGSFALNMGNVIALETKAPVVHYNPYEVIVLPRTENSFYRLTYKDDKIQKTTTTPEFADIDKSTYKPTKRDSIRFEIAKGDGYVMVSNKKDKKEKRKRIIAIENISRGGLAVVHDGSLVKGEKFVIDLDYHNIKASPEVEVVRVTGDKAGLKFINLDKATANKILYMNMYMAETSSNKVSQN